MVVHQILNTGDKFSNLKESHTHVKKPTSIPCTEIYHRTIQRLLIPPLILSSIYIQMQRLYGSLIPEKIVVPSLIDQKPCFRSTAACDKQLLHSILLCVSRYTSYPHTLSLKTCGNDVSPSDR